jgi:hypothetical protein
MSFCVSSFFPFKKWLAPRQYLTSVTQTWLGDSFTCDDVARLGVYDLSQHPHVAIVAEDHHLYPVPVSQNVQRRRVIRAKCHWGGCPFGRNRMTANSAAHNGAAGATHELLPREADCDCVIPGTASNGDSKYLALTWSEDSGVGDRFSSLRLRLRSEIRAGHEYAQHQREC